ncbi:MAG: VOC family protein [Bacteroidales bacterium]
MNKVEMVSPKAFSHIGFIVPDLNATVKFYQKIIGWYIKISNGVY